LSNSILKYSSTSSLDRVKVSLTISLVEKFFQTNKYLFIAKIRIVFEYSKFSFEKKRVQLKIFFVPKEPSPLFTIKTLFVQEDKRSRECPKGIIPAPKFTN
jgi:hypothetical protein